MTSRVEKMARRMRKKMPGTKDIKLTPIGARSVAGTPIDVENAEKRPITNDERLASQIDIEAESITWMIWKEDVEGGVVRRSWHVTETDGTKWEIKSVTAELLGNRLRCPSVRIRSAT